MTANEYLAALWQHMFGHHTDCELYGEGVRALDDDACQCFYEWDSGTLDDVANIIDHAYTAVVRFTS